MKKKEFCNALEEKVSFQLTKKEIEEIYDCFLDTIRENIKEGEEIHFVNLGKFSLNRTKEREGRNPSTNEKIIIPPKNQIKFSASSSIKNYLNEA